MTDHQYLSIGEVLGLLLEDFPDVTISKIRFLESQGLIEPERTPSGYRKFYDDDVELLRAILHEQRENFLPLKVIRDRIEAGEIAEAALTRTPPRGIRNVDARSSDAEPRDSVFRRTDGDPTSSMPIPGAAPTPSAASTNTHPSASRRRNEEPVVATIAVDHDNGAARLGSASIAVGEPTAAADDASPTSATPAADAPAPPAARGRAKATKAKPASRRTPIADASGLPFERDQLCAAAAITDEQLTQLESYGIVVRRGADATFAPDTVEIARIAGRFLEQGIDARHLRAWRQSADREAALYEQRIMPLLRQRNPQSRQLAVDSLAELEALGGQLRDALVASTLRHHYDGV